MDLQSIEFDIKSSEINMNQVLKIVDRREYGGVRQFLIQTNQSSIESSWHLETGEPWMQQLIKQFESRTTLPSETSMDVELGGNQQDLKQNESKKKDTMSASKEESIKKKTVEEYDKLDNAQIKVIIDRFISKIKGMIGKLKGRTSHNIYCAIMKVVSFYNDESQLGLIVKYTGSDCFKFISYNEMKDNHSNELRIFLEEYMLKFNNNFIKTIFEKNYRLQANYLGSIFQENWKKDAQGNMVRVPKQTGQMKDGSQPRLGSQALENMFAIEFDLDEFLNGRMMDEAEEPRRDYQWGQ